jgi:MFS family permease
LFNSARVIGPWLGGVTYAAFGASWCFLLNGLSFVAVIGGLLFMMPVSRPLAPSHTSPWKQLTGGLSYVRQNVDLLALLLLALIASLFGLSYSAVLPAFVDQILHGGAEQFGNLNAATGLGAVIGALVVAQRGERGGWRGRWLVVSSLAFPAVLLLFANTAAYLPSLMLAFGLGLGFMIQFTLINTLLQTRVEDTLRGRVMSLYTLTFFGLAPFGNLAIGALSEVWGLSPTISLSAVLAIVFTGVVLLAIPPVRKLA